ncbi:rve domain-containing protein [Gossypium australe]|uniref:Rve domain-containing protein n=1 Tax=Gossypium australe TaxID=47621 RepID=A0A5B6UIT3_9ROSI|nr:rve domain-containing protein [Gossypium australe]
MKAQRKPAEPLQVMSSPWPFATRGIDIFGSFPIATIQKKFIVVAVDYFTKWIEAEALATISERQIEFFLWKLIVYRFGVPRLIVTDNGTQF